MNDKQCNCQPATSHIPIIEHRRWCNAAPTTKQCCNWCLGQVFDNRGGCLDNQCACHKSTENLDWQKGHVCPIDDSGLCDDCPCHNSAEKILSDTEIAHAVDAGFQNGLQKTFYSTDTTEKQWTTIPCNNPEHRTRGCKVVYYKGSLFDCFEKLYAKSPATDTTNPKAHFLKAIRDPDTIRRAAEEGAKEQDEMLSRATDTAEKHHFVDCVCHTMGEAGIACDCRCHRPPTDTSDWQARFRKVFGDKHNHVPGNMPIVATGTPMLDLERFIETLLESAREQGKQSTQGRVASFQNGFNEGQRQMLTKVQEVVAELADEVRLYSTDTKPLFAKVVFTKRLSSQLEKLKEMK